MKPAAQRLSWQRRCAAYAFDKAQMREFFFFFFFFLLAFLKYRINLLRKYLCTIHAQSVMRGNSDVPGAAPGPGSVPAPRSFVAVFGPGAGSLLLVSATFVRAGTGAAASLLCSATTTGASAAPTAQAFRLEPPEGGLPLRQRVSRALAMAGSARTLEEACASAARLSAVCRVRHGGERLGGRLADDVTEVVGAALTVGASSSSLARQPAPVPPARDARADANAEHSSSPSESEDGGAAKTAGARRGAQRQGETELSSRGWRRLAVAAAAAADNTAPTPAAASTLNAIAAAAESSDEESSDDGDDENGDASAMVAVTGTASRSVPVLLRRPRLAASTRLAVLSFPNPVTAAWERGWEARLWAALAAASAPGAAEIGNGDAAAACWRDGALGGALASRLARFCARAGAHAVGDVLSGELARRGVAVDASSASTFAHLHRLHVEEEEAAAAVAVAQAAAAASEAAAANASGPGDDGDDVLRGDDDEAVFAAAASAAVAAATEEEEDDDVSSTLVRVSS